jgi:bifunctional UDP-N-acetylglucosamine pyrophosphorylase/glucosamine-1-phosphate N-acetyltransferase
MTLAAVILAAGQGTRMKSDLPKVLHRAAGRTLLDWALGPVAALGPDRIVVVVGHEAGAVTASLPTGVEAAVQEEQLGTGHAVGVALQHLGPLASEDRVLVSYGDMPLVTTELLNRLLGEETEAVMVATRLDDPGGYGRVIRRDDASLDRVVEERDATPEEAAVNEVNAGLYVFRGDLLQETIARLAAENAQREYYLPDVLPALVAGGHRVTVLGVASDLVLGVNSPDQLAQAEAILRRRINLGWMREGVFMPDPERVYIDATVELAAGARIYPGVHLEGACRVEAGAAVGPDVFAADTSIGAGARVWYSVLRSAWVGPEADVGPFASLRPGTVLEAGSKAGTFVEMKNTTVGEGAKVPHLAYMGDATIGARANIGAGSITCNYDGYDKYETVIGEEAFIGSDTMLVAPVTVGRRAVTGAGSVITRDVGQGALAVERSVQKEIPGYAELREERHRAAKEE